MNQSIKIIDGLNICFRQWNAYGTYSKFLSGKSISFKILFEGDSFDYDKFINEYKIGNLTIRDWFNFNYNNTCIVSESDTELDLFIDMEKRGIIQLRIFPESSLDAFSDFVFNLLQDCIDKETDGECRVISVDCMEN